MRVLLVNTNLKDDLLAAPPIGLCYVATATEAAGHEVRVVDLCFKRDVRKTLEQAVRGFSPDVVGLSVRNIDNVNMLCPVSYLPDHLKIVNLIKGLTDVPLVVGGAAASLDPEGILRYLDADFIVVSDGERSFAELLRSLESGSSDHDIPGVGSVVDGTFRYRTADLNGFQAGNAEVGRWIDVRPYFKAGGSYNIQSKRGCRHHCIYCVYQIIQGQGIRMRDPVDVVDELEEAYYKYKSTDFEFVDSVFNDPVDHAGEILEEICRRSWRARFTAIGVSPAGLDRPFLDLMWRAGFRSFMLSPESASEVVCSNYGKSFSIDTVVHAAEALNETELTTLWYFLVGGPGETDETLQETVNFILKYLKPAKRPPYHNINMFLGVRIYPGTALWDTAMNEGVVNHDTDPLQQCWYISPGLDLERAIDRMLETAVKCPELYLGFDESVLGISKFWTTVGDVFKLPKPYWRHLWGINRLLIKFGLRFVFKPKDTAAMIRRQLEHQGYTGPLLADPGHPVQGERTDPQPLVASRLRQR